MTKSVTYPVYKQNDNKCPFYVNQSVVIEGPMNIILEGTVSCIIERKKLWSVTFKIQDPEDVLDLDKVTTVDIAM